MSLHEKEIRRLIYAEPKALYHSLIHSLTQGSVSIIAGHMENIFSRNGYQPQRGQKIRVFVCVCV